MTLLERCRQDRDALLEACRQRLGLPEDTLPADLLDDVLDHLEFDLVEEELPEGVMGEVNFDRHLVTIARGMERRVRPNTDLVGVTNSTKAHELGHIRLHEEELHLVNCRDLPADDPGYLRREYEADVYAGTFLVLERLLFARPEMTELLELHSTGGTMSSEELWERVLSLAAFFRVTGSLMRHLLVTNLGLLRMAEPSRELSVSTGELVAEFWVEKAATDS